MSSVTMLCVVILTVTVICLYSYAERDYDVIMLRDVMLRVFMLSLIILNDVIMYVIMLSVLLC
jgi:hypothetical protein